MTYLMKVKTTYTYYNLIFFILGFFILFPFGIELKLTELFIFQIIEVLLLSTLVLSLRLKVRFSGLLDQLFLLIVIWSLISYLGYFYNFLFSRSLTLELIRLKSLIVTCTLYISYYVGKTIFTLDTTAIKPFFYGIFSCSVFFDFNYLFRILSMHSLDLMRTRVIIEQRIPMVISYVSVIAFVFAMKFKKHRIIYFFVFLSGTILVLISVTRAAYLQLTASLVLFTFISLYHKPLKTVLLSAIFLILVGFLFARSDYSSQITGRVKSFLSPTTHGKDISISYRLQQWNALIDEMIHHPDKLVFGHGQLGASYIKTNVNKIESSSAHSQYLDILIREGVFGLILFVFFFIYIIYLGIFRQDLFPPEYKVFVFANSIGLFGVFFYGFFHESIRYFQFGYFYMLFAGFISYLMTKKGKDTLNVIDN
jgi:O-antigen ligase